VARHRATLDLHVSTQQIQFRPRLHISWSGRGENGCKERRAELRRVLQSKVEEMQKTAVVKIEARKVDGLTLLAQDALECKRRLSPTLRAS
jgi:hypothetical protein